MATLARSGRWRERPEQRGYRTLLENLRSKLTWLDVLVGFCAAVVISAVLTGFRYRVVPEYEVDQIANEDIRAGQDVIYEDTEATSFKVAEAVGGVSALYELRSDLIADREKVIRRALSDARELLAEKGITSKTKLTAALQKDLSIQLADRIGQTIPVDVLAVLLRQYFDPVLEGRILNILDTVLRDGIVNDRGQFLKDQREGILIRDISYPFEHPIANAYLARDLTVAREYVRQFHLDFAELSQQDKVVLMRFLETLLFPTLIYNHEETESRRTLAEARVKPVQVQIRQGQTIVRAGEKITPGVVRQLNALRNLHQPRSLIWQFSGYFLFVAVLLYSLWRYFIYYQTRHRKIRSHTVLILVILASELLVMRLTTALADILGERFQRFHDPFLLYYATPFAFGALLTTLLIDVNLGVLTAVILAILTGLFYGDVYIAAYLIIGSIAGIYSIRQYKDRAAILKAGLTIGAVNVLCLFGLDILRQTALRLSNGLEQIVLGLLSGMLASTLASILLPALEALFKVTTDIRLLELSNLNAPMLRRLSVEAPGTYHHSLMVATLAEAAAESVGANPLLTRVAAYYHDLGKMLKPEYFVENQSYGSNKHEGLSPSMSCLILASHVKDGLEMAKEIGLPQRIRDMIPQHHGTRVMTYFYRKAKEMEHGKGGEIVEADFRYPGPKPQSKEAAIMMMADSVEAASRTLSDPTPVQIQGFIDRLVDAVISENQFDECDITLRDVQRVKESFFKILTGIFHHRIDYPGYDFRSISNESERAAVQNPGAEQTKAG